MREVNLELSFFYTILLKYPNIKHIDIKNNEISFTFKGFELEFIEPQNGDLVAVFANEEYNFLDPKNEVVIDIRASIGDSPIYFCVEGARQVIALEPYPYTFKLLSENVNINGCTDKIIPLNAGYGKSGLIRIDEKLYTKCFL